MDQTENEREYHIINPDNFKEFFDLIPKMREATRMGIKREIEENKIEIYQADLETTLFDSYANLIRKKWTFDIIIALSFIREPYFSDLKNEVPLINNRTLTNRLKSLSRLDIIERIVHDTRPVRVSYKLTPFGEGLRNLYSSVYIYIILKMKRKKRTFQEK
ncbi:MAG: winged helix-turn-helix transcriptional regulator [Promethearchaeota archaeon]